MWGGDASYPGKPYRSEAEAVREALENRTAEETPRREGSERVAGLRVVLMIRGL